MFISYQEFEENLSRVQASILAAEQKSGRLAGSVRLLPVTKNHPVDAALYAFRSGLKSVGENRVQEALSKMDDADSAMGWELIGPLQSNKAKKVAECFDRVQSVDRAKVAKALQRYASEAERNLGVLLQINAGADPNKSGASLEEASALMECALGQSNLKIDGLMTIAPLDDDPAVARACFAALRKCRDRLEASFGVILPELSMGMSGDMEAAIQEGSTMVRVGTALYGKRDYA
ncbi:MAG: YggS family pyridoxal phosphate-dependent enzyme [Opitutales bacterium]|jgi:PLP dependent protein|nr:YggS family pyridoxal phosphate-dependent enzyme [Opitutales bacterium]MDG2255899.1 YggS family pyridoxal phosphate-dependent enzyme [Opitutaceae bacterium]MBT5167597.1 YggS family pyridoxal phosphate-dependent enzyme [Opitutales bacterium]MBT5813204.1 YggS family pyridoxal phosphate-dependent enzyme [Opitutales bacterium]MBT6380852.1 YggS family pyridoxal phosphate-dependent enzyme [Opitutales bacterium]